ncbi:hypothetical protein NQ317_008742 [Molorchus minor]|uniref:Uncharacterized protein n=1 Tax=Molorchus minor TaxID=1323400 RepID=A0ABQ9JAW8_9CUCU|nr:hypothetical protein NQ317_008742 [Molorchus minor]
MEDLHFGDVVSNTPGNVLRPKSMCVPDMRYYNESDDFRSRERVNSEATVNRHSSVSDNFNYTCKVPGQVSTDKLSKFGRPMNNYNDVLIIQKEHIEENFMLGLSALIAGDFVFLPSDTRICKAFPSGNTQEVTLTLFIRVRFFYQLSEVCGEIRPGICCIFNLGGLSWSINCLVLSRRLLN